MAAFSVTVTASPSPYLLQLRRFSTHLQGSALQNWRIGIFWMQGLRPFAFNWRRRRTLICAVNQDAKGALKNTIEIDSLIDMLRDADPHELQKVVIDNRLVLNASFWIQLAARTNTCKSEDDKKEYEELAMSVMSMVDRLVHTTNEKIESSTDVLKGTLQPVVDGVEEISCSLRDPQALTLMKQELSQREQEGQLDEGFLAEVNAQLRQAKEDGDKPGLEALLQKVLYASEVISKRSYANKAWLQFAKRVSGEWDGFGADFSNEGKAIELPESVVPEAFREWEVKVFDWQTQCPTLAKPEDHILEYKSIQLLPTVGCEADAATRYSIDERKVGGANSGVTAFAYQSSGSYVAVWQKKDKLLELEYCLIKPQDFESRVRIIQIIHVLDNSKMMLQSIRVFREQWYGPFRNGEQLGGCAIRDSAFASTSPMTASQVAGIWQGSKAVATFGTPNTEIFRELLDDKVQNSVRDGSNNILLPKKLWCSLRQNEGGETLSEVGWLLDHGQAITSSSLFSSTAKLEEISIALETKAVEDV